VTSGGTSQTTNPPSEVTPASRLPDVTRSTIDEFVGNVGGSLSSARAPLLRAMRRTRPRVMAYAIQLGDADGAPGYIDRLELEQCDGCQVQTVRGSDMGREAERHRGQRIEAGEGCCGLVIFWARLSLGRWLFLELGRLVGGSFPVRQPVERRCAGSTLLS
jgi:hypothetical protein